MSTPVVLQGRRNHAACAINKIKSALGMADKRADVDLLRSLAGTDAAATDADAFDISRHPDRARSFTFHEVILRDATGRGDLRDEHR
ncbi:hypothetical protein K663_15305 [Sphingobium sp. MI1205]|nr:hypothetical protein K663_15305 [Sphingobium sp. MI1205]